MTEAPRDYLGKSRCPIDEVSCLEVSCLETGSRKEKGERFDNMVGAPDRQEGCPFYRTKPNASGSV